MPTLYVGPDKDYESIESALTFCREGDNVVVSPGRYEESLNLTVPDITISAEKKRSVTITSRPGEDAWNAIDILASHVTLRGLIIEGQSNRPRSTGRSRERGSNNDWTSAIQVQGTDVAILGCRLNGTCSIGIKTYAERTTVRDCDIDSGKSALIVLDGATATIEGCQLKSIDDTGIWLWGASPCTIENVVVNKCGNTGIWLDSAPAKLRNVEVNQCNRGIVCDWPMTYSLKNDEYFGLSHQGHLLNGVRVKECKENGMYIYPGVRVIVKECVFNDNSDAGVFFEGYEDDDHEKQEARRIRSENCDQSIVQDSEIVGNQGYGVEAESEGLVVLVGQNNIDNNVKGACYNVTPPGKRARVSSGVNDAPAHETRDSNVQPHISGSSSEGSTTSSSDSEENQEDFVHEDGNAPDLHDRLHEIAAMPGVCPVAVVTAKAGIETPVGWQPGLIYIGEYNVDSLPSIDRLENFYVNNSGIRPNPLVEIKPSPGRGMGLFAKTRLRRGTRACFYSGVLRRQQTCHEGDYVFKYRPKSGKDKDDNKWEIDAEFGGNEGRYANHPYENEEANMVARYRTRNGSRVIALEMLQDVEGGEELLWDYGEDYWQED